MESIKRKPLEFKYDPFLDHMEIEGIVYSGDVFRFFSECHVPAEFEIVKRENGVIHIHHKKTL